MKEVILFFLSLSLVLSTQYITIPSTPQGIPFGASNASIIMDLVYDPICHDTKKFDQNVFRNLQKQLPENLKNKVKFNLLLQPLPYHTTAMKIIQGLLFTADHVDSLQVLTYFRSFLDNIDEWSVESLASISIASYMDKVANKLAQLSGLSQQEIRKSLQHYTDYDLKARTLIKHLTGTKRNGQTPTIFINGAKINGGENKTAQDWIDLLNSL